MTLKMTTARKKGSIIRYRFRGTAAELREHLSAHTHVIELSILMHLNRGFTLYEARALAVLSLQTAGLIAALVRSPSPLTIKAVEVLARLHQLLVEERDIRRTTEETEGESGYVFHDPFLPGYFDVAWDEFFAKHRQSASAAA